MQSGAEGLVFDYEDDPDCELCCEVYIEVYTPVEFCF